MVCTPIEFEKMITENKSGTRKPAKVVLPNESDSTKTRRNKSNQHLPKDTKTVGRKDLFLGELDAERNH